MNLSRSSTIHSSIAEERSVVLQNLASLIANVTDSYSSVIFLTEICRGEKVLRIAGHQTLSRDFVSEVVVGFGAGLVGWTAEQEVRISVCPFERDARTLLYYERDQELKSFIAVPIFSAVDGRSIVGVIACDSKKSYAYPKITEKILAECAAQIASSIALFDRLAADVEEQPIVENPIHGFIDKLREQDDESSLLKVASEVPSTVIERDALVVMATAGGPEDNGSYYTAAGSAHLEHRLMELVCKHKKVLCPDRSVHVLPVNDVAKRSFLSVPLRVLGKEAGSFNLLSNPLQAFSAKEIEALEAVSVVVSRELERLRLREQFKHLAEQGSSYTWEEFVSLGDDKLKRNRGLLSLVRVSFGDLAQFESQAGPGAVFFLVQRFRRIIAQVAPNSSIVCKVCDGTWFLLMERRDTTTITNRIVGLLKRMGLDDASDGLTRELIEEVVTALELSTIPARRTDTSVVSLAHELTRDVVPIAASQ